MRSNQYSIKSLGMNELLKVLNDILRHIFSIEMHESYVDFIWYFVNIWIFLEQLNESFD